MVFSLVVVDQFNVKSITGFEAKNDAPIGPYRYGPQPFQVTLKWVQAIPGQIESFRRVGGIENGEDAFNRFYKVWPYSAAVAALIEAFQRSMLKALDHPGQSVK